MRLLTPKTKEAISFYYSFAKKFNLLFWLVLGLTLITISLQLVEPYIYKKIINVLESSRERDFDQNISMVINFALIWLVVAIFKAISNTNRVYFAWRYVRQIFNKVWIYTIEKTFGLGVDYHANKRAGETIKTIDRFGESIWHFGAIFFNDIMLAILNFIMSIIIVFYIDWRMALISMGALPLYLISNIYAENKTAGMQQKMNRIWEKAWGIFSESISNIVPIKAFAQERIFVKNINRKQIIASWLQDRVGLYWAITGETQGFSALISRLAVIGGGAYFVTKGTLTIGDIIMFLGYLTFLYAPIQMISSRSEDLQRYWKWYKRGLKYLSLRPNIVSGKNILKKAKGHIEFKNVSFQYSLKGKKQYAIKKVSFEIKPGTTTALVGHSGAGKTTATQLLQRFYDPTNGKILFDGQDLKTLNVTSLRQAIGIVFQENILFHNTIAMNIKLGKPNATKEQVESASKKAAIHEFISKLENGYNTKVGERGIKLSGGQRQRIAIARAIIKNPALIIFDEATSALDSKTEQNVQKAIKNLTKDKSTLIIAHRLSTVMHADQIIVMDKAEIVAKGTHKKLMEKCDIYKEMINLQTASMIIHE